MKQSLKIILFIGVLLVVCTKVEAQNFSLVKTISSKANKILVDKFDLLYIVENYKISQYNTKGDLLFIYENLEQGEISKVDVSNPLKPIVYYEDFNVVCILDNKLGLINTINLFDLNLNQISAISIPNTMQFWVYDKIDTRLKLYDKNFNLVNQSENFLQLFNQISDIKAMKVANNQIYLLDNNGIKVFDQFGTFVKKYTIQNIPDFQVFNQRLIFFQDNVLKSIHELSLEEQSMLIENTQENISNALLLKNHIFIQTDNSCNLYSIK